MKKITILLKYTGITLTYIFITVLIGSIFAGVLSKLNISAELKKAMYTMIAYILAIFIIFRLFNKIRIADHISILKLNVKIIIAIIFFFLSFPIVYQNIFVWFISFIKLSPEIIENVADKDVAEYASLIKLLLRAISVGIVAPIAEELYFRVFTIEFLRKEIKTSTAIIISSLVFSIVHLAEIQSSIEIFISAIIIGIIYIKTNNVIYCIIAHSIHNIEYLVFNYFKSNNMKLFSKDIMLSSNILVIYSQPVFIISIILMIISLVYLSNLKDV